MAWIDDNTSLRTSSSLHLLGSCEARVLPGIWQTSLLAVGLSHFSGFVCTVHWVVHGEPPSDDNVPRACGTSGYKVEYPSVTSFAENNQPNPPVHCSRNTRNMASDKIGTVSEKQLAGSSGSGNNSRNSNAPYISSAGGEDLFFDRTISVKDWFTRTFDNIPRQLLDYVVSLFPIATWIYRYNLTWFIGDVCFFHPSLLAVAALNFG